MKQNDRVISEEDINALLKYLGERPYKDVHVLINKLFQTRLLRDVLKENKEQE